MLLAPSSRSLLFPGLLLALSFAVPVHAEVHPSLGDRRTPPSEDVDFFFEGADNLWTQAMQEVLAQPQDPASNDLTAPPLEDPDHLPLVEVRPGEIERFRIPGPANQPLEVLMVLDSSTVDEAQAVLDVVKQIHRQQAEQGVPQAERLRAHFVLRSRSDLNRLDLTSEELETMVVVDRYYSTSDIWMQDWGEIATVKRKGQSETELCLFDSRRGRGLGDFAGALARQWGGKLLVGPQAWGTKGNYGGNIEVTPDDFLVIGDTCTSTVLDLFRSSGYQDRTVVLDAKWLRVGHVDEYMVVVPVPDSPAGYVVVKADATRAMELVQGVPEADWPESLRQMVHNAFQYYPRFPHVARRDKYGVQEEFRDLAALRVALSGGFASRSDELRQRGNQLIQENHRAAAIVDENVDRLVRFLEERNGGVEVPVVSFPGLFTQDGSYRALLPGVSNLVVLGEHLLIPDPLVPELRADVVAKVEALGLVPHLIPNLTYHYMNGEIHCGSNVRRHPGRFIAERYGRAARFR